MITGRLKNFYILSGILTLGLALFFTPLKLLSLVILVVVLALLTTFKNTGFITRSILIFTLYTCVIQIIGFGFWKFDIQYTYFWAVFPLYIPVLLYGFINRRRITFNAAVNKSELLAFSIAGISTGIIFITTFGVKPLPQESIRYIARGFDNATHLTITDAIYQNQGYLYGDKKADAKIYGIKSYPQGWHLSSAVLWRGLPKHISPQNLNSFLFVYVMTVLLWYFLFSFGGTLLLLRLVSLWSNRANTYLVGLGAIVGLMLFQLIIGIPLLRFGFSNFIATMAYLFLLVILCVELSQKSISKAQFIIPASLLATGIAISWLLAAPIGYLIILGLLIDFDGKVSLKKLFNLVIRNALVFIAAAIVLAFGFIQGIIQILYSTDAGSLNLDGGIWNINPALLAASLLVAVLIFYRKSANDALQRTLMIVLCSLAIPTGFIYYLQYHTMARTSYYFEKIAMMLLAVSLITALALGVYYIETYHRREGLWKTSLLLLFIIFSLPLAADINTSESRFALGGDRKLSEFSADQLTELISRKQAYKNNVVIMKGLDYEEDNSTTNFIKVLSGDLPICNRDIVSYQMSNQFNKLTEQINQCAKDKKFYIITSGKYFERLKEAFKENKNIELILSS